MKRRRRGFALTREGRVFVLVTVGVGIAAVNTGNNLLYLVLGLLLSLLLTSGVLSDLVLFGVRVRRKPAPRVFAGSPTYFEIEVENAKSRLASLSLEVLDVATNEAAPPSGFVLKVAPRELASVLVERTATARGMLDLTEIRVRTRYPFGIVEKTHRFVAESRVVVFPRLVDAVEIANDVATRGLDTPVSRRGHGPDVIGLRDYRELDPARDIHWRKTAARSDVVVRERARENDPELTAELPSWIRDEDAARAEFELAVSHAATLVVRAVGRGRSIVVRAGESEIARARDAADLDRALTALALHQPTYASDPR